MTSSSNQSMGAPQFSFPLLNGENYDIWCVKMKTMLLSKGVWDYVENEFEDVKVLTNDQEEKSKKNAKALSMIQRGIKDNIFKRLIKGVTNAKKAWDILYNEYGDNSKAEMEKLFQTAEIYYNSMCPLRVREAAQKFFEDIERDTGGKVPLHKFLAFMMDEGHVKMSSSYFFKIIDRDENGTLEFMEVMTLFYIIQSGRPFCLGCGKFIADMYFTCSKCYYDDNPIFLCPKCLSESRFTHPHGRSDFLDNFAMLHLLRKRGTASSTQYSIQQNQQVQPTTSPALAVVPYTPPPGPPPRKHKWKKAFNAFQVVVDTANLAVALAGNSCTIM